MERNTNVKAAPTSNIDEELIDTLIAISVVAKRLAANLRQESEKMEDTENEQRQESNERDAEIKRLALQSRRQSY